MTHSVPSIHSLDPVKKHLFRQLSWSEIDSDYLKQVICLAIAEDVGGMGLGGALESNKDLTTYALPIDKEIRGYSEIIAKQDLRACGLLMLQAILDCYGKGCSVTLKAKDGDPISAGTSIAEIYGPIRILLSAERILLNFLQHLSGIATQASQFIQALGITQTKLLDTRKTTPGFRVLEKYAVACGGCWNHRIGLFDHIMLKDNHFAVLQNDYLLKVEGIVRYLREQYPRIPIEIEVDRVEDIPPLLASEPDIILLDNFSISDIKKALKIINKKSYTEASGNIEINTLPALANLGLDFISCGALTHQARWCDISMEWLHNCEG